MKTSDIVPISLTRRELYDLVWSAPVPEAAARLGISRTWLTKICHRAGVPYPSRAYWGLLASGKQPVREKLAPARSREDLIILRPRGRARPAGAGGEGGEDDLVDLPDRLTRLHPVLTAWRVEIWHEQERLRREPWRKLGPPPAELGKRRLRLLDILLKSLERRGHAVESCAAAPGVLAALIDGRRVEITLREDAQLRRNSEGERDQGEGGQTAEAAKPWLLSPPLPALSLAVQVGADPARSDRWEDAAEESLEDQLAGIVSALALLVQSQPEVEPGGSAHPAGPEANDLGWLALRRLAARWDGAERVRRMLAEARSHTLAQAGALTPEQVAWLQWAEALADEGGREPIGLDELMSRVGPPF